MGQQSPEQRRWQAEGAHQQHQGFNPDDASVIRWWLTLPWTVVKRVYRLSRGLPARDGPENVWERKKRERRRR